MTCLRGRRTSSEGVVRDETNEYFVSAGRRLILMQMTKTVFRTTSSSIGVGDGNQCAD